MNIPGSKMGNRRSANIRSVGYSDLFSLSKDDLWETLEEYPEAKKALLEKGREILIKDNMIDEEKAKEEAAAHETNAEAVTRLGAELEVIMAGMADMMAEYRAFQVSSEQGIICRSFRRFVKLPNERQSEFLNDLQIIPWLVSYNQCFQVDMKQRLTLAEKNSGMR